MTIELPVSNRIGRETDGQLLCLLAQHRAIIAKVQRLKAVSPRPDNLEADLHITLAKERILKEQLMDLEPQSIADAQSKIIHFVGYLCAKKSSLDEPSLTRLIHSLRQFL